MFIDEKNFYPTPLTLTQELFNMINEDIWSERNIRVLEPSAGKGDLIEGLKECYKQRKIERLKMIYKNPNKYNTYDYNEKFEKCVVVDCIEIDPILSEVLKNKDYNVIHSDFLTFEDKFYDLIIMNPPFSNGCEHLLKAIRLQERIGGKVACILNAETIKNPYSNNRKELINLLEKYKADIKFVSNAFKEAERKTDVEVALIYLDIPMLELETMFEKEFKEENPNITIEKFNTLTNKKSKIEQLTDECNLIKKSVSNLFKEKMRVDNLLNSFGLSSEIKLCDSSYNGDEIDINKYYSNIDYKYWRKFIDETDLLSKLPTEMVNIFNSNMEARKNIPFNIENAFYFYEELVNSIPVSYEQTVAKVFDECTIEHYYSENEWCKNIHYYNGWKTNKSFKINGKVIIPWHDLYGLHPIIRDLTVIFENLSGKKNTLTSFDTDCLVNALRYYSKNIETEFFIINAYKKGTIHIKFKDKELLNKFNIIASKGKNWLPPSFGSKSWDDMEEEERQVIINFGIKADEYNSYLGQRDYLKLIG